MEKRVKMLSLTLLSSISILAVVVASEGSVDTTVNAGECSHEGNHYTQLVPTSEDFGCKEYWVCCKCHEHFLEEPSGNWTDAGVASQIIDENDNRYWGKDIRTELEKELDESGFKYTVDGDKVTITGYDSSMGSNIVIPEGVTNIQAGAFKDVDIDVVVLPSTIKKVDGNAFKDSGCAVSSKGGDDFTIYVSMTEKEFNKLKNSSDWNSAYDQSPWGLGLIGVKTEKANVVFLPNWQYVEGIPTAINN